MTESKSTLVTFLLDRSGSMQHGKPTTIEAFNGYLGGLKSEDDAEINFTMLQFDTGGIEKLCVATPVRNVADLTDATFQPRGGTPLIDAAYKTIKAVEDAVARDKLKSKIVVCILTDGHENESTEHGWEELKALIDARTAEGWEFMFMGAGIDAYDQARRMGISATNTVSYDRTSPEATCAVFDSASMNTRSYAAGRSSNTSFSMSQRASAGDAYVPADLTGTTGPVAGGFAPTVFGGTPVPPIAPVPGIAGALDLSTKAPVIKRNRRITVPDIEL